MNAYAAPAARPAIFGVLAFGLLIAIYLGAVTLVSAWQFTVDQFAMFRYYMVSLGAGFGRSRGISG